MRILVLENEPSSNLGGQELSLLDVCRGLAARGHEINLLYLRKGDLLDEYRKFASEITCIGCYTINRKRTLASAVEWLGSISKGLRHRADVIYANQYHDTLFGGVLAKLWRRPLVCHLRLMPPAPLCTQFRIGRALVSRYIANSVAVRDRYIAAGYPAEKFAVVYNGIDLAKFSPARNIAHLRDQLGLPADSFVIIYVGRLDPAKGIDLLLRAVSLQPRTTWVVIVGSPVVHASQEAGNAYVAGLQVIASDLGIAERVRWLGRRRDLPQIYAACDVLVLPTQTSESFGRVLAEAMACGIPAVGAQNGGIPEVLCGEFSQHLFSPSGDHVALAERVRCLSDWRTRDPSLSARCRKHIVDNFALDTMVTGVEGALWEAVSRYNVWAP